MVIVDNTIVTRQFLKEVKGKSEICDDGCVLWTGFSNKKGLCYQRIEDKNYNVHHFLWNYHNPDNPIKQNEICVRSCGNKVCISPDHLRVTTRKKAIDKQGIWKKILENSTRQENGCLHWNGYYRKNGYAAIPFAGGDKSYSLHRVVYWINSNIENIDDIPDRVDNVRMMVRHLCNNSHCHEPLHLKLGNQYENDYNDKLLNNTLMRGGTHYNSSIDAEKANLIKLSKLKTSDPEYKTQKERAIIYNVSLDIIKSIDCGKSWAHIPDADGNVSSKRREKAREQRLKAKNKIWTKEMFDEARVRLEDNSTLSDDIKKPFVNTSCRIWNRKLSIDGYGHINIFGKKIGVHILACEIQNNFHRPENMITRHKCGRKSCCEPEHMIFGTPSQNHQDYKDHSKCIKFKLTEQIVREIRNTYKKDGLTQVERAKKYNISVTHISKIENFRTWKKVK